jgi:Flp pilus assembly pilin Flp
MAEYTIVLSVVSIAVIAAITSLGNPVAMLMSQAAAAVAAVGGG